MEQALNQLERMVLPPSRVSVGTLAKVAYRGGRSTPPMTKLVEVLLGIPAPSQRPPTKNFFIDPTLNDSQKAAI